VKQSERVPYTHSVRPGGTEQAAQCRRRRAPEEDVAGTRKQGIILLPKKQSTAEGQPLSPGTAPAPENKKRASQSRHPPAATAGQDWGLQRRQLSAHLPRRHGRSRGEPSKQILPQPEAGS
jgi:hypothetical protein